MDFFLSLVIAGASVGSVYALVAVQVRNIFAPVAKVKEDDIAGKALSLLTDNNGYKIGAYEVEGSLVLLSLKIPDNATPQQLVKAVQLAASVADEKEKAISGTRDTY